MRYGATSISGDNLFTMYDIFTGDGVEARLYIFLIEYLSVINGLNIFIKADIFIGFYFCPFRADFFFLSACAFSFFIS